MNTKPRIALVAGLLAVILIPSFVVVAQNFTGNRTTTITSTTKYSNTGGFQYIYPISLVIYCCQGNEKPVAWNAAYTVEINVINQSERMFLSPYQGGVVFWLPSVLNNGGQPENYVQVWVTNYIGNPCTFLSNGRQTITLAFSSEPAASIVKLDLEKCLH